jgi:ribosome-binding ATPase YchF (GTP1/OBG family)
MRRGIGLVGLPNVGKSSLFNLLTRASAKVDNFPFCTIDPNEAQTPFFDERLEKVKAITGSKSIIYHNLKIIDIAGLVQGASKGEGLGNKFLANIRETDAIFHVVRCFEDKFVTHVLGGPDPIRDWEIINLELQLADLETIEKMKPKLNRDKEKLKILNDIETAINLGKKIAIEDATLNFLSQKPMVAVLNGEKDSAMTLKMIDYCEKNKINYVFFPIVNIEDDDDTQLQYLNNLINIGFKILNLIFFFTTGPEETRAWCIENGNNAVEAAGKIHSSFSTHFIAAEVIKYEDYINNKKSFEVKGKSYIVNDGDIILFKHNAR